jgi:type II secretory pathway pseudopilin PulG
MISGSVSGDLRRSVKSGKPGLQTQAGESGFTLIEVMVVTLIIFTVAAMAILAMNPNIASARSDSAMREVMEQLRQAREYAIENRRYVSVTFPTVSNVPEVVITQLNSKTANAGNDKVLSTLPLQYPIQFCVCSMGDTPDGFGNSAAIYFESTSNGPSGGMWYESDGELIDGTTYLPINGTVFLGVTGQENLSRAVTVLGTTGRVRAYKSTGSAWFSF